MAFLAEETLHCVEPGVNSMKLHMNQPECLKWINQIVINQFGGAGLTLFDL